MVHVQPKEKAKMWLFRLGASKNGGIENVGLAERLVIEHIEGDNKGMSDGRSLHCAACWNANKALLTPSWGSGGTQAREGWRSSVVLKVRYVRE